MVFFWESKQQTNLRFIPFLVVFWSCVTAFSKAVTVAISEPVVRCCVLGKEKTILQARFLPFTRYFTSDFTRCAAHTKNAFI
jgi:hypothetical protein